MTFFPSNKTSALAAASDVFSVPVPDKTYLLGIYPTDKWAYSKFSSESAARGSPDDFCPLKKRCFEIWLSTNLLCLWKACYVNDNVAKNYFVL